VIGETARERDKWDGGGGGEETRENVANRVGGSELVPKEVRENGVVVEAGAHTAKGSRDGELRSSGGVESLG
jgi:hypothetical protein